MDSILADEDGTGQLFDRVFSLISALDGVPETADELDDFYVARPQKKTHALRSVVQQKKAGQEAWMALMDTVESKEQQKRILDIVSTVVAPWFTKPELLADFLHESWHISIPGTHVESQSLQVTTVAAAHDREYVRRREATMLGDLFHISRPVRKIAGKVIYNLQSNFCDLAPSASSEWHPPLMVQFCYTVTALEP